MEISVFGSGYVGLVQAAVMADVGHQVICVDVDSERVESLRGGDVPFFEPGLSRMLTEAMDNQLLSFTVDAARAIDNSEFIFIAVGTPAEEDGSADLQYVLQVADTIGQHMQSRKVVITKSTVPVGTSDKVKATLAAALAKRETEIEFDVVSNPEFLKEGSAITDATRPDRIIIGTDSERAINDMRIMYQAYNRNRDKLMIMDARSAEMTKYAANAMLATKISFMNEMANIAEKVGADIEEVRRGMGADPRIGYQFIYPGAGYGGSCFPKDIQALKYLANSHGHDAPILTSVHDTNLKQREKLGQRVLTVLGNDLSGKTIALWGLSFKPNTDDMREAPSRNVMEAVWAAGGKVQAFDPQSKDACRAIYGERDDLNLCDSKEAALDGAELLVICTEWKAFFSPNFSVLKERLNQPIIIDGRNLYDPAYVTSLGLDYYAIGRGLSLNN